MPNYSQYYKVSVTDSFNCVSNYDSVLVALNPPLIINTSSDTIVCPYDSLDIGVMAMEMEVLTIIRGQQLVEFL